MKDTKLTPRIAETARGLWVVYFAVSVLCFLAYRAAGMSWADAFMHMCSTMGLGGFSSHDASFGYWNSPLIEAVAVVFMTAVPASASRCTSSPGGSARCGRCCADVEARAYCRRAGRRRSRWSRPTCSPPAPIRATARRCATPRSTSSRWRRPPATPRPTTRSGRMFAPMLMILLGCFADLRRLDRRRHEDGPRAAAAQAVAAASWCASSIRASSTRSSSAAAPCRPRVLEAVIAFMMIYGATLVGADLAVAVRRARYRHRGHRGTRPASTTSAPDSATSGRRSTTAA